MIVRENRELYAPVRELWRAAGRRVSDPWRPYGRFGRLAIVGSIPECEFPLPPRFPARVRYVGPLIGRESASAGLDKEALAFVRRKEDGPLIHLTLGMTFSETAAVLRKVAAALLDAPVRLLVSSGNLDEDSIRGALPSRRLSSGGRFLIEVSAGDEEPHGRVQERGRNLPEDCRLFR